MRVILNLNVIYLYFNYLYHYRNHTHMKLQYIFAFLLISCSAFSQYDIVWETQFGGTSTEEINDLLVSSDGSTLTVGYSRSEDVAPNSNTGFFADAYVTRLSPEGEVLWQKVYGGSDHDFANSVVEVSDGYIFVGYTLSDDGDISSIDEEFDNWVVKLDFDGELIWEKVFNELESQNANQIIETSNGDYAILGSRDLIIISEEGEILNAIIDMGGLELIQDEVGDFIIGSVVLSETDSWMQNSDYLLTKVSSQGVIRWQKEYEGVPGMNSLNALVASTDGYIMGGTEGQSARIIKVDLDGNLLWNVSQFTEGAEVINDLLIDSNEHIFAVGSSEVDGVDNLFLAEIDTDGTVLWDEVYIDSSYISGSEIVATPDDGYYVAVSTDNGIMNGVLIDHDIAIIKLLTNLDATANLDPTSTLQLYPNPVSDQMLLTVESEDIGSVYSIYNSIGKLISHGQVFSTNTEIDINTYPLGTYTLSLRKESRSQSHSFVKL